MLTEPIVEGAYYISASGSVHQFPTVLTAELAKGAGLTRVHLVPTDPAEVVAELRKLERQHEDNFDNQGGEEGVFLAFGAAADLVAEKLGVKS